MYIFSLMAEPIVKPSFNLTALNCSAMLVSWEAISCLNNSGELPVFLLQIAPTGQNFTTPTLKLYSPKQQYIFTGLERHTRYYVQMAVMNSAGVGDWTENNEITQGLQIIMCEYVCQHIILYTSHKLLWSIC